MVSVAEAEKLVLSTVKEYGTESIHFSQAVGRVLAEEIKADRDLPPYNRVAMDGIAIAYKSFENGLRRFFIKGTQAAGNDPIELDAEDQCIEIMTGSALPSSTDTVVRYEDLQLDNGFATIVTEQVIKGQSVHAQGSDKKRGEVILQLHEPISPAVINVTCSVGKTNLLVKKLPSILIISTGNELVDVGEHPSAFEIRRSNNYTIRALLASSNIEAHLEHLPDEPGTTSESLQQSLNRYDVIILSGGISMGKFDYVPKALEDCGVKPLFYKVAQRPGKPFWFGKHVNGTVVFAFPGNPVSTFMCARRYLVPWLNACLGNKTRNPLFAMLDEEVIFKPPLQYFLQVQLKSREDGMFVARPIEGNGSGDFANLTMTDAFMELPADKTVFKKGEVYRVWSWSAFA